MSLQWFLFPGVILEVKEPYLVCGSNFNDVLVSNLWRMKTIFLGINIG
jgi:hypothetical protein